MTTSHTVLVVDDDRDVADLYATWLEGQYAVSRAYGGHEALDALDDTVDVVFLDRRMPGFDGCAVLDAIDDRSVDPHVIMVTAVEPAFDILEMPVDDYLVKPVSRTDLLDAVTSTVERATADHVLREYYSLAAKRATLEAEKSPAELSASDAYQRVATRINELRERADGAGLDDESDVRDGTGGWETTGQ